MRSSRLVAVLRARSTPYDEDDEVTLRDNDDAPAFGTLLFGSRFLSLGPFLEVWKRVPSRKFNARDIKLRFILWYNLVSSLITLIYINTVVKKISYFIEIYYFVTLFPGTFSRQQSRDNIHTIRKPIVNVPQLKIRSL